MVRLVRPWPDHFSVNFSFLCTKKHIIIKWPDHFVFVIDKPDHLNQLPLPLSLYVLHE